MPNALSHVIIGLMFSVINNHPYLGLVLPEWMMTNKKHVTQNIVSVKQTKQKNKDLHAKVINYC